jgi:hypothetical protein
MEGNIWDIQIIIVFFYRIIDQNADNIGPNFVEGMGEIFVNLRQAKGKCKKII